MNRLLIGISGASGSIYGIRLLEVLKTESVEVHLIISSGAQEIITYETSYAIDDLKAMADVTYDDNDLFAGPASGSYHMDGMAIVPCSMKTLAAIAHGYSDNLLSRSATCMLKEGRPLVLTLRETPLDLGGIENMVQVKKAGAIVLPAMPAFYHKPQSIDELVDFIVGKILDQLRIPHDLFQRWE
jgi:4-hydroxy-3-polyprenylbenzoate decarboxylase